MRTFLGCVIVATSAVVLPEEAFGETESCHFELVDHALGSVQETVTIWGNVQ